MKEFRGMIIGRSVTVIDFLQLFPAHNRKGLWNATPRSETLFKEQDDEGSHEDIIEKIKEANNSVNSDCIYEGVD
ncbi:hypothetical protein DKX38_010708 [Salix brachista]|uniref:Uncharacterized protein n=1 Tax=Salix brachista TaxID=2182728 RepID=A0A5N5MEA5_9ROSI|nr:hypothetical protein DKX38_010708 [Salix brachista]